MTLDLRPLTLGELFDRAFMLYRRHFWLFVGVTAVPGVFALVMTLAQQLLQSMTLAAQAAPPDDAAAMETLFAVISLFGVFLVAMVLYWIVYMIALGATTFAVSELYLGRLPTIAQVYGRMRGRIGALIVLFLLTGLRVGGVALIGVFLFAASFGVGAATSPILGGLLGMTFLFTAIGLCLFMMLRYGLSVPALVLEGRPPGESIQRSVALTQGRLGRIFLLGFCATMVTYAALIIFQGPFFAAAVVSGLDTSRGFWLNVVGSVAGTVGATLSAPFLIIGLALIYYDARIREEGLDLELSLAALDQPDTARV